MRISTSISRTIVVDNNPPVMSFNSWVEVTNPQYTYPSGPVTYFNSLFSGSFTVKINASDGGTGMSAVSFPDLDGAATLWTPGLGNAPLIAGCVANFQCRAVSRYYGGDHVIFLGAVEAYAYNAQQPLLFLRGGYGQFAAAEGIPDPNRSS